MQIINLSRPVVLLIAGLVGLLVSSVGVKSVLASANGLLPEPGRPKRIPVYFDNTINQGNVDSDLLPPGFRFAVIGDYGDNSQAEADVADLVKGLVPEIVITTGDNNYPDGAAETIDVNIGQYYSDYIFPYDGDYGTGALENRFFPSLGNHDWVTNDAQPYLDYFTLPGNERYYDFKWDLVHFFVLDSDSYLYRSEEVQADWLETKLTSSDSRWKIVVTHYPPYSSSHHGSKAGMQWSYADWGADALLAGHDHTYERISPPGDILYFVNGLGGRSIYGFPSIIEDSQVRYNEDYGAMLVEVTLGEMRFQFINRQGEIIDDISLEKPVEYQYIPILLQVNP